MNRDSPRHRRDILFPLTGTVPDGRVIADDCVKNYRVHPTVPDFHTPPRISSTARSWRSSTRGFSVLEEGLALRPSDFDVVWTSGYGFPRHKGGPMQWAEERGLRECCATLERLAAERPDGAVFASREAPRRWQTRDAPLADCMCRIKCAHSGTIRVINETLRAHR